MANIGYRRVSTRDQNISRQLDGVQIDKCFDDYVSGGTLDRPEWAKCVDYIREGDTLFVHSIDRLARNLGDLEQTIKQLNDKGVVVHFVKQSLTFNGTRDPMHRLLLQVLGAFAEFEREVILERQAEGIAKAKAEGRHCGRPRALSADQLAEIKRRQSEGEHLVAIAKSYGVSRQTVYAAMKQAA